MSRAGVVAAILAAGLAGCGESDEPRQEPVQFETGRPLQDPPVVKSSDRRLDATIVAKNGEVGVSGVPVSGTQTYAVEGQTEHAFIGPTLQVKPGDTIDLTFDNELTVPAGGKSDTCSHEEHGATGPGDPQPTNLHFHGLHVTPRDRSPYGDSVIVALEPGESHIKFKIPRNHDRGTFWYHAHLHGCTDDQVFRGLAGMLLVGDSRRDLPRRFRKVPTRVLALKDIQTQPAGDGVAIADDHDWANPTQRTVNGFVEPVIDIRPKETQLWRIANISSAVWYQVALAGGDDPMTTAPLTVVAQDGNSLLEPRVLDSILVPPGRRFDVLVSGPDKGPLTLRTLNFDQGRLTFGEADLATVEVGSEAATALAAPKRLAAPSQRFPARRGPRHRFVFSFDFNKKQFALINNKPFNPKVPLVRPRLGTTERWTILNRTTEWHPFHIHQDDFRVVRSSVTDPPQLPGDQDVVALPPQTPDGPGKVVIDMPFTDYPGKFVFHCHILDHEDGGMMALVDVRKRR